jgi:hypothetical protein
MVIKTLKKLMFGKLKKKGLIYDSPKAKLLSYLMVSRLWQGTYSHGKLSRTHIKVYKK